MQSSDMSSDTPSSVRRPAKTGRVGVLLVNLGTPEATSYWPMRAYLKEFLSDRRVIETNRALWWVILNGIILTTRPKRSGHAYEKIWNRERNESPLKTITRAQAEGVAAALAGEPRISVDWAMRYGKPPIAEGLGWLKDKGCDRILIFPLYPQYAAATTASVMDKAFDALKAMRSQPTIREVPPYFDDPGHIAALAESVRTHLGGLGWTPDRIVASFHGLPEEYVEKGDPYRDQCEETVRLLRAALGREAPELVMTFQSRFGRAEWIKPYTDATVEELAKSGIRNLVVITPGFAADCVETLEEIGIGTREVFLSSGGGNFSVVPCLNAGEASILMLTNIVRRELSGWI